MARTPSLPRHATDGPNVQSRQQFIDAWQSGSSPRLEDLLSQIPSEDVQPTLLELLQWEIAWRKENGETPDLLEYLERFPEYASVVQSIFRVTFSNLPGEETPTEPVGLNRRGGSRPTPPFIPSRTLPQLENYDVLEEIGQGGMGIVYKAWQRNTDRFVALKMLGQHVCSVEDLGRFRAEVQAIARLNHPNIVPLYEAGEHEGRPFFAMELCEQGNLRRWMESRSLSQRESVILIEKLARGIAHAHAHNIVHRDLKPGNILLTQNDEPCITDFGIAKQLDQKHGQTRTGSVIGTPDYMSPEQASGNIHAVGPATDIYALGVILYELLTGHRPIEGPSEIQVLQRVMSDEPVSISSWRPDVSPDLDAICQKCLEKEPHRRYGSALGLAEDLARWLRKEPVQARPVNGFGRFWRWCRRKPLSAAVVGLSILCCLLLAGATPTVWLAYRSAEQSRAEAETEKARAETERRKASAQVARLEAATGAQLVERGDYFRALIWTISAMNRERLIREEIGAKIASPQEQLLRLRASSLFQNIPQIVDSIQLPPEIDHIQFDSHDRLVGTDFALQSLAYWDRKSKKKTVIGINSPEIGPFYSKDGKWSLARNSEKQWHLIDMTSSQSVIEIEDPDFQFDPDDFRFTVHPKEGLILGIYDKGGWIWSMKTGKTIWMYREPHLFHWITKLLIRNDGRYFLARDGDGSVIRELSTKKVVFRTPTGAIADKRMVWSNDGRWLVRVYAPRNVEIYDVRQGLDAKAILGPTHADEILSLMLTKDGKRLLTFSADATARVWSIPDSKPLSLPLVHSGPVRDAQLSPDERFLLTVSEDGVARIWDLYSSQLSCPPIRQGSDIVSANWSPSGREFVTLTEDGLARIWTMVNTESPLPLTSHEGEISHLRFSPDNKTLLVGSVDGLARLWDVTTGRAVTQPLRHSGTVTESNWDDEQKRILTIGDKYVRTWDLRTSQPLSDAYGKRLGNNFGVIRASFLPNTNSLALAYADRAKIRNLKSNQDIVQVKMPYDNDPVYSLDVSPDGSQFLTANTTYEVFLWDAKTSKEIRRLKLPLGRNLTDCRYSADGKQIQATGSFGIRIWKTQTGEKLLDFKPAGRSFYHARTDPKLKYLLTISTTNQCQLWDIKTRKSVGPPIHLNAPLHYAGIVGSKALIFTVRKDGQAQILDATIGKPVTPMQYYRGFITAVAASSDGTTLALGTRQGHVFLCNPPSPRQESAIVLQQRIRYILREQIDGEANILVPNLSANREPKGQGHEKQLQVGQVWNWHDRLAIEAKNKKDWSAVSFHLEQLQQWNQTHRSAPGQSTKEKLQILSRKMEANIARQEFSQAQEGLQTLINAHPDNLQYRIQRVKVLGHQEKWNEAIDEIKEGLKHNPRASGLLIRKSLIEQRLGKLKEADQTFRQVVELTIGAHISQFLGTFEKELDPQVVYDRRKQWQPLVHEWQSTLKSVQEDNLRSAYSRARGLANLLLDANEQALNDLQRSVQLRPQDVETYRLLALVHVRKKGWTQAKKYADLALQTETKDGSLWYLRAKCHQQLSKTKEYFSDLCSAIENGLDTHLTRFDRGVLLAMNGVTNEALTDLTKAIEMDKGKQPYAWYYRGLSYLGGGMLREAAHDFQEAAKRDHLRTEFHRMNVLISFHVGELEKARPLTRKMIQILPRKIENDYNWVSQLVWTGCLAQFSPKELEVWLPFQERCIIHDAGNRFHYLTHAYLLLRLNQPKKALEVIRELHEKIKLPSTAWEYLLKSLAYKELGQTEKAARKLKLAHEWRVNQMRGKISDPRYRAPLDFSTQIELDMLFKEASEQQK